MKIFTDKETGKVIIDMEGDYLVTTNGLITPEGQINEHFEVRGEYDLDSIPFLDEEGYTEEEFEKIRSHLFARTQRIIKRAIWRIHHHQYKYDLRR